MAKKAEKKSSKNRGPAKAAKKTPKSKKIAKSTGKTTAAKTATRKIATKTTTVKKATVKKASRKKLPAKVTRKVTKVTSVSKTKRAVKPTGRRPNGPATRKQSIRHAAQPTQPAAAAHKPAASISPQPAPAFEAAEAFTHRGVDMAEGFQPGQRVRHRYEHWWGTIVQKADSSGNTMAAPAPVRYVVTVDGGKNRDDIRPEDLTVS